MYISNTTVTLYFVFLFETLLSNYKIHYKNTLCISRQHNAEMWCTASYH